MELKRKPQGVRIIYRPPDRTAVHTDMMTVGHILDSHFYGLGSRIAGRRISGLVVRLN